MTTPPRETISLQTLPMDPLRKIKVEIFPGKSSLFLFLFYFGTTDVATVVLVYIPGLYEWLETEKPMLVTHRSMSIQAEQLRARRVALTQ